jgi:hypothetical protein
MCVSVQFKNVGCLSSAIISGDCGREAKLMQGMTTCGGLAAAGLLAWLLLMPPLSISGAGKTVVNMTAPLSSWEVLSRLPGSDQCRKRRDDLRAQLEKAGTEGADQNGSANAKPSDQSKAAFATLKERATAARCVADNDPRLRPSSAQTH